MNSYQLTIDKSRLRAIFSKAAKDYDRYALLQARISDELFNKLKEIKNPLNILDIGSGTARLTKKLSSVFPEAKILGLDFASGMLDEVKNKKNHLSLIQADAQFLSFKENSFDLVISNLSYQWVDDLTAAFNQVHNVLKSKGRLFITIFGKDTLKELKSSFFEDWKIRHKGRNFLYRQLPDEDSIYRALAKSRFKDIRINRKIKRQTYQDLFSLLKWLKFTGSNYNTEVFFNNLGSRQIFKNISDIYKARYHDNGKLYATFEVIYAQAIK